MQATRPTGILLINVGTPDAPDVPAVRRYLREFLSDPRMIDLPAAIRWAILNLFILPFRPKQSAHAYQQIWTKQGSPLLVNSVQLRDALATEMGDDFIVTLGMRYGKPSLESALQKLLDSNCKQIIVVPLFPQYASSSNGSAIAKVFELLQKQWNIPPVTVIDDFFVDPNFIQSYAELINEHLADHNYDTLLFSYHGLPERHLDKSHCDTNYCQRQTACPTSMNENYYCYRKRCYATSQAIANTLQLPEQKYTISFQSRLGRTPWIKPYTDELLPQLYQQGVRKLAVACPSFVSDCLETLEEIGLRAKEQWLELGGEQFHMIPCLNVRSSWVRGLREIISQHTIEQP